MNEENNLERQLSEILSRTEPLTIQGLEDEIIKMLACLHPLPIKIERVKGVSYPGQHSFLIADEKHGIIGEDTAYRWDVGNLRCNGLSKLFTTALHEAQEHRTEKVLETREIALSDLNLLEADRRAGNISEKEYRLVFDGIVKGKQP